MAKLTERQLIDRVRVQRISSGAYKVYIEYRGEIYSCTSHNSLAWDMLYWEKGKTRCYYRSSRQAWEAFYDECKRANKLGEYRGYNLNKTS